MKVQEVYDVLNEFAPFYTQCGWDNSGLLVGNADSEVTGIMLAMDVTKEVIAEATQKNCNLIVSHHPIIFNGIKSVMANTPVYKCIENKISVISAHTNLDKADGGVNTALAEKIKLINLRPIGDEDGIGLVGDLPEEMTPDELAVHLEKALGLAPRYNRNIDRKIRTVGICGGSGANLVVETLKYHDIQGFITADVRNNQFVETSNLDIELYDCGHNATERVVLPVLQKLFLCKFRTNVYIAESYNGAV